MTTFNDHNSRTGLIGIGAIPPLSPVAAFNPAQIENLLRTKGILAFHARHAPHWDTQTLQAGANMARDDIEHPNAYYDVRPILMVPQQLSFNDTLTQINLNGTGTAVFNITGEYIDEQGGRVYARTGDLIIPNPTLTDLYAEREVFRGESPWRMHYRINSVDYMACKSCDRLEQDVDFTIDTNGAIIFVTGMKTPKIGEVVSMVYYTTPIYTVQHIPHSLRILPGNASGDGRGTRTAYYGPQLAIVQRSMIRAETYDWLGVLEAMDWQQYLTMG
jgi:hypothetical protein